MAIELLIDSAHGVYIPEIFARNFDAEQWGIDPDDMLLLADYNEAMKVDYGESYWHIWTYHVLDRAKYIDDKGNEWLLWQDGDLWAICYNLMTDGEYRNFFGEDRDEHF